MKGILFLLAAAGALGLVPGPDHDPSGGLSGESPLPSIDIPAPEKAPEAVVSRATAAPPTPSAPAARIERMDPCEPPTLAERLADERRGAGPVVRFHTRTSRAEESEAYRKEIESLPAGLTWPLCREMLAERGFTVVDSTWGPRERPRFALLKEGLLFQVELTCDHSGRITSIDSSPNL